MGDNLTGNLKKGITIGFYTKIATQVSTFVFGIILARLLTPADYGLVGVLAVFIALIRQFQDLGFSAALLQQKRVRVSDYNTVFVLNVLLAIVFYAVFYFSAPYIANFFGDNRLILLVRILGLVNLIQAFGTTLGAYLNKTQKYMQQAKVYYIALVAGNLVAVIFAYFGFAFWALVIKSFVVTTFLAVGWWIVSAWKPHLVFSMFSVRRLSGFGIKLFVISLFETLFNNLYSLIIGKLFNVQALGYFNRAKNFSDLPDQTIRQSLFGKVYPTFSYFQDDNPRLIKNYMKLLRMVVYVMYPIFIMLGFVAFPLIKVLLTDKWLPAAPLLQIISVMAVFYPFESIFINALYVKGRSGDVLRATVIRRILFLLMIFVGYRFGIKGLVWVMVADSFVISTIGYIFVRKVLDIKLLQCYNELKIILFMQLPYGLAIYFSGMLFESDILQLISMGLSGLVVYFVLSIMFEKQNLMDFFKILHFNAVVKWILKISPR